jgi:DNA-binding NarL/FixJ family response regulator
VVNDALLDELRHQRDVPLTPTERDVLAGLVEGLSTAELARRRDRSEITIKTQIGQILGKLAVSSRGEAAYLALLTGLVVIEPSEIGARIAALRAR